jgi:hypothetical protein
MPLSIMTLNAVCCYIYYDWHFGAMLSAIRLYVILLHVVSLSATAPARLPSKVRAQ